MTLLMVILAFGLMAMGAPIFSVMLGFAAYGATTIRGFDADFGGQIQDIIAMGSGPLSAPTLSTIPLFILAGFFMAESKTADRMVRVARAGLGWLPGGLAIVTIFACAIFTTFTGASGVTIVALGGLVMPSLLKEKYPERFSLGLVGGTGSVGLLFPPALPLFVYGTIYGIVAQTSLSADSTGEMELIEFSTDRFILAGIVPGLVLLTVISGFAIYVAIRRGVPRHKFDINELGRSFLVSLPEIALPVLIIGGLANGISIPEVAALACVYVFAIEAFVYRDLKIAAIWKIVGEAMALVGAIFIIMFAAQALTQYFKTAEVPQALVEWIKATFHSKWMFLIALNVLLLIVGMLMDIFSAIVVVVPLIVGPAQHFGIDPFHLGVIFLLNLELGYLTPPVGLNLFITAFAFRKPIMEVIRATLPFLACMFVALVLVTYIPQLTVVPPPERRGRVVNLAKRVGARFIEVSAVDEIEVDGKIKKKSECEAMKDATKRQDCMTLFIEVTQCRKDNDAECETDAIDSYLELQEDSGDDDWNADADDDEDEDEGDETDEVETAGHDAGADEAAGADAGKEDGDDWGDDSDDSDDSDDTADGEDSDDEDW